MIANPTVSVTLTESDFDRPALVPWEIRVDRVDNQNGTHTLFVDSVQVGPPIRWDDTTTEHYVRETCKRIQLFRAQKGAQP